MITYKCKFCNCLLKQANGDSTNISCIACDCQFNFDFEIGNLYCIDMHFILNNKRNFICIDYVIKNTLIFINNENILRFNYIINNITPQNITKKVKQLILFS